MRLANATQPYFSLVEKIFKIIYRKLDIKRHKWI